MNPAARKSLILINGIKYPMWILPVHAMPMNATGCFFSLRSFSRASSGTISSMFLFMSASFSFMSIVVEADGGYLNYWVCDLDSS